MSAPADEARPTTVFIGSVTAGRQRSFLVACDDCGGGYYLAARTVREMRAQGRRPVCRTCRRPDQLQPERHAAWAVEAMSAMSPNDREAVTFAFTGRHVPAERVDLALAASAAPR